MAGESTIVIAACVQWGGRFYNGTHIHTTIYHALSARLQFELGLAGDFLGCHFEPFIASDLLANALTSSSPAPV